MVKIRLFQIGKKKKRMFRVVIAHSKTKRNGKYIEKVGFYNPHDKENNFKISIDRVNYWKSKGAQETETVKSLIRRSSLDV